MKILKFTLAISLLGMLHVAAQERTEQALLWPYQLPENTDTGPSRVMVKGTYYFTKEALGNQYYVNVFVRLSRIEYEVPPSFRYKGIDYSHRQLNEIDGLDLVGFQDISVTSIGLEFPAIAGFGITNAQKIKLSCLVGKYSLGGTRIATCTKETDVSRLNLMEATSFAYNMNWTGSMKLQERIERALKQKQNKENYKNLIGQADNAFYQKNYEGAKSLYQQAGILQPRENYPNTQLAKIEQLKKASETTAQSQQKAGLVRQSGAEVKKNTPDMNAKTGNTTSITQNSSQNADPQLSEKVMVNGEYVQVFKRNGIPYIQYANGAVKQTSEAAYNQISQVASKNDTRLKETERANTAKKVDQERATAQVMDNIKRQQEQTKQFETDLVAKTGAVTQAFFQNSQAENSLSAARETGLHGVYESVEEIEKDFSSQMEVVRQETANYEQAKIQSVSNYIDAAGNYGTAYDGAINSTMKSIAGIVASAKADKARKEEQARLKAEREAQLTMLENRRKAAIFGLRKKMLDVFSNGKLPLESSNVQQDEVYVFAYIGNREILTTQLNGTIWTSNVIAVSKQDDGTFPYKSAFANGLKKFGTGDVFIVGYYLNQADAIKMQSSFTELAEKSGLVINRFDYSKKAASPSNTGDFWETGNAAKEKSKSEAPKKSNFWNQ